MSDRPKFLNLDEASIANWREHPVTAALLEWLALEADRLNYESGLQVRKQQFHEAAAMSGKAEFAETLWKSCHRKDAPKEEDNERPFVDPAFRFDTGGQAHVGTD